MTEEADEAVESAKSEVNSHPLKMEIEIEEEIKEDRDLVRRTRVTMFWSWKAMQNTCQYGVEACFEDIKEYLKLEAKKLQPLFCRPKSRGLIVLGGIEIG